MLAEALALARQIDLLLVFGPAGLRERIVWRCETAEDRTVADEERDLLSLPLGAELVHRRVELSRVDLWSEVPDAGRLVFSPRAPAADLFHVAWVRSVRPRGRRSMGGGSCVRDRP